MSRSNPTETTQNPATRWISWNGGKGELEYYDKEKKENVTIGERFSFLLLDSLSSIRGWHEPSESGIYSNEVRDTRADRFVVKAFKAGILVEGFYSDIKDRIHSLGGAFNSNLYLAYKDGAGLKIGALTLKGAALSAWMEFSKANRPSGDKPSIYNSAVQINGSDDGKKGSVSFKTPRFSLIKTSEDANEAAAALDVELQEYLKAYLAKNKAEQVSAEPDQEDPETEARKAQAAEWQQAQEEDRRQRAGGDTRLRELANRVPDESDDLEF